MAKKVTILRAGNRIVISPTTPKIADLLRPQLTFTERVFLRGREALIAKRSFKPTIFSQDWECFAMDHRGRIATTFGFAPRIRRVLRGAGYKVVTKDLQPHPNPEVYRFRWERLEGTKFRYKQREALELIAKYECGRIDCHPGWGKSFLIAQAARCYPKAKIAVITRRVPVMLQRIYPELCSMLPSVGIVGGGRKIKDRRVMCYTTGSLQHATGDEDIVFIDEGHEICSDDAAYKMSKFQHARIWMFSGSWDMRLDSKDMRAEAMAGPIRIRVPYEDGVRNKMVVPITIVWRDVISDTNPASGYSDVNKKRYGVWTNEYRNSCIATDARLYDEDVQTLITVETFEHALHLKRLLPEFTLVYNCDSQSERDLQYYREQGLIDESFRLLTPTRREKFTRRFERGRLRKVIATPVWNVGVSFNHLQVLIRADAGGSPINDTQIPGRTSRLHSSKVCGIVHDYLDQFDVGLSRKAAGRRASYARNKWKQICPSPKHAATTARDLREQGSV